MPLYIVLGRLTHKAIANAKEIAARDTEGERIVQEAGGRLLAHYYTFGRYDFVAIVDAPSEEAMVRILISIGRWGTVSTETMTAMPPSLVYKAIAGT